MAQELFLAGFFHRLVDFVSQDDCENTYTEETWLKEQKSSETASKWIWAWNKAAKTESKSEENMWREQEGIEIYWNMTIDILMRSGSTNRPQTDRMLVLQGANT